MAYERVTLYGLPLVAAAPVGYAHDRPRAVPRAVHPPRAGGGRLADPPPVLPRQPRAAGRGRASWRTGPAGATSSSTTRRCSLLRRAGPGRRGLRAGTSTRGGSRPAATNPTCSTFTRDCCSTRRRPAARPATTRTSGSQGDLELPLTYQFEPGAPTDGVTVHIPLALLNQVDAGRLRLAGARPARGTGHRPDPVAAQGGAPHSFVPAPDFATAALAALADRIGAGDLRRALAETLEAMGGSRIAQPDDFDLDRVPGHLLMTFTVQASADPGSPSSRSAPTSPRSPPGGSPRAPRRRWGRWPPR